VRGLGGGGRRRVCGSHAAAAAVAADGAKWKLLLLLLVVKGWCLRNVLECFLEAYYICVASAIGIVNHGTVGAVEVSALGVSNDGCKSNGRLPHLRNHSDRTKLP
jgi:hypothetical protein